MSDRRLVTGLFVDDLEAVIEVLRDDGWTCEYHEPDKECRVCQRLHKNTAERILAALGISESGLFRPRTKEEK